MAGVATCGGFSLPAPSATTLFQSPVNASEAVVLTPNCSATVRGVVSEEGDTVLHVDTLGIEVVDSFPSVYRLFLDSNVIQSADFSNDSSIEHLILAWNELTSLDGIELPPNVYELDLEGNILASISASQIPESVGIIYLGENNIRSMDTFDLPDTIESLYLHMNRLSTAAFTLPPALQELYLDSNAITELANISFPDTLSKFSCADCGLTTIRGVEFSAGLQKLDLTQNRIATFEIRQTDVAVFKQLDLFTGTITQQDCQDASAEVLSLQNGSAKLCVISDESFAQKYPRSSGGNSVSSGGSASSNQAASSNSGDATSSSSNTTLIAIVASVGGVLALGLIVIGYRVFFSKHSERLGKSDDDDSRMPTPSTMRFGSYDRMTNSQEYLSNDIRTDAALLPFRIAQDELEVVSKVASGGYGSIFHATYRGRDVAVKQILPEKARNPAALQSFMDEIRMCAALEHPRIVAFIGVAWSTLVDVAVVIEFMSRGDLSSTLRTVDSPHPSDWFQPSHHLKPKRELALEIAEALVYLHSFERPIVHRDLKARNVLLDAAGDAKLSDFGVSRELSIEDTMTGDVGTVAWIAPEVLQGRQYSERADLYSFGVLLVELDTCRHPYDKAALAAAGDLAPPVTNTLIAMRVCAGSLAPVVSPQCPPGVAALVRRCLSFDPQDRPTAVELHYELRGILAA